ncbi:VCBS repeat-containing protein [Parafrankia sp. EUN1f]|uniref:FG-GAP repeat domain-containing protein n=1 Tax=Parafrankia sp. EUN1f TaxID=102897 RepID=UPI0001C45EE9|nr:VCBS repeat-containing protein [Parafrankia sp. EUN1f]EFC81843.1 FG-GAP repeat protein [Parafrankia sp. EUN1f]
MRLQAGWVALVAAVMWSASWAVADSAAATSTIPGFASRSGDFNGDGRDDILSFDSQTSGVDVALSIVLPAQWSSLQTFGVREHWADTPRGADDLTLVGDADGDGMDDLVTITARGNNAGAVRVWLSTGSTFVDSPGWQDSLPAGQLVTVDDLGVVPAVGDFNGDGLDDVAAFVTAGSAAGTVRFALSTGTGFDSVQTVADAFPTGTGAAPEVGDLNGDGLDDLAVFTRGATADVYVSLSTGYGFDPAALWHDSFAGGSGYPAIGDFNGDGRDDVVTFTHDSAADVYVALSTGSGFSGTTKWQDNFALWSEYPGVGDADGDGRDDILVYTGSPANDVWVALSTYFWTPRTGIVRYFGNGEKWHDNFSTGYYALGIAYWP